MQLNFVTRVVLGGTRPYTGRRTAATLAAVAGIVGPAKGETVTFTGAAGPSANGATYDFNNANNWSPVKVPVAGDIATFSATPPTAINSIGFTAGASVGGFLFANQFTTANPVVFGNDAATASTLTLGSGLAAGATLIDAQNTSGTITFQPVATGSANTAALGIALAQSGVISVAAGGAVRINSVISQVASGSGLTKTGSGTLLLTSAGPSSANLFTGGVTINEGVVEFASGNALGGSLNGTAFTQSGAVTIAGGALRYNSASTFSTARTVTTSSAASTIDIANATLTLSNGLRGSATGAYTKVGAGTLVLSGTATTANNFSGGMTIRQGVVEISTDNFNAIGLPAGTLTLDGGTLRANNTSLTSTSRTVSLGAGGGTISVLNGSGGSVGVTGVISGDGGLTKIGTAGFRISGANTYAGGTTVTAGALLVNNTAGSGTGAGAVTVAAGATLGGSGTIAGNVSITGTLAPGNSPGVLTIAGATTMQAASAFAAEVGKVVFDAAAPVPGTDHDQLALTGTGVTLTLTAGARLSVLESGNLLNGQAFTIVDNKAGGLVAGVFSDATGTPLAEGASVFGSQGGQYSISYLGGDVTLTAVNVVPEPASAGLLGVAAVGLLRRRRRARANR